jgi:arylsulfate sulfotransferase
VLDNQKTLVGYALSSVILLTFATFGCGSGSETPYISAAVSPTQNLLVAEYDVTTSVTGANVWVEFGTDQTYGRSTSNMASTTRPYQTVKVLVAGMKPTTTYHMRAHIDWTGGSAVDEDRTFTTGSAPLASGLSTASSADTGLVAPGLTVTRPNPSFTPSPGIELVDIAGGTPHTLQTFATDLQGNIIWYYDVGEGNSAFPIRGPLANGHFLVNIGTALAGAFLREVDLAGNTAREVAVPAVNGQLKALGYSFTIANFHHDVLPLPSGDWIALGQTVKAFTNLPGYPGVTNVLGDVLIDINPTGNVVWAWSTFDHLDVNRHPYLFPDWTHSNAILYTPNDGNLLLSIRHQSWIIKIDYQNGKGSGDILWRLGYQGDFQLPQADAPSDWFFAQHFPSINRINGSQITLSIMDNGDSRIADDNGDTCGGPGFPACYSRAVIFQFDESTKAANLLWADSPGLYSFFGGGAQTLPSGNVEFDLCTTSTSFTQQAAQVMEVTQVANPQTVWQLNINGADAYRAYRIPSLYPGVTWQK